MLSCNQCFHINVWWILAPDAAPINIEADNSIPQELTYSWKPPPESDRNGIIQFYEYELWEVGDNKPKQYGSTKETTVTFTQLLHYTDYEFKIRASTSQGGGPFSEPIPAKTSSFGKIFILYLFKIVNKKCYLKEKNNYKHSFALEMILVQNMCWSGFKIC